MADAEIHQVAIRSTEGAEVGTVTLADDIFGIKPNVPVLHQVVIAQLAAARRGTQSTKTRAEVSGGGKKPFKQKGTGRARQGSERAPHFIGGGVALGPKPRSYRQKTPKKMIALALRSALSDRAADGKVVVVNSWAWEKPSTKGAIAALEALGLSGKVLMVLDRSDDVARRSFRNLPDIQLLKATELNAYDILVNDWIVFTEATLPGVAEEVIAEAEALVDTAEAVEDAQAVDEVVEAVEAAELIADIDEFEAAAGLGDDEDLAEPDGALPTSTETEEDAE
jgi:large subunit ribosomal protein L4